MSWHFRCPGAISPLETVSRAISHLHDLGVLGFIGNTQRQIVLLDRQQLASLDLQN
jgi:CRP/FNR family nitrogen fixation transcriptional regulator